MEIKQLGVAGSKTAARLIVLWRRL